MNPKDEYEDIREYMAFYTWKLDAAYVDDLPCSVGSRRLLRRLAHRRHHRPLELLVFLPLLQEAHRLPPGVRRTITRHGYPVTPRKLFVSPWLTSASMPSSKSACTSSSALNWSGVVVRCVHSMTTRLQELGKAEANRLHQHLLNGQEIAAQDV